MKPLLIPVLLLLTACNGHLRQPHAQVLTPAADTLKTSRNSVRHDCGEKPVFRKYADHVLSRLLDSIGTLSPGMLAASASGIYDSVQRSFPHLHRVFTGSEYRPLQQAIRRRSMPRATVRKLFNDKYALADSIPSDSGIIPVQYYLFDDRDKAQDYAIILGDPLRGWSGNFYFFHGNKLIARHEVFHHNEVELHSFRNEQGRTIVYYKVVFDWGSGVSQLHYFFYCYNGDRLVPCLNLLQEAHWSNYASPVTAFGAEIMATRPLTVRMSYDWSVLSGAHYLKPCDSSGDTRSLAHGSNVVRFRWDDARQQYTGVYPDPEFTALDVPAYYPVSFGRRNSSAALLFIRLHYASFRRWLQDPAWRSAILYFLDLVKANSEFRQVPVD